jgi:hypothetical protein
VKGIIGLSYKTTTSFLQAEDGYFDDNLTYNQTKHHRAWNFDFLIPGGFLLSFSFVWCHQV